MMPFGLPTQKIKSDFTVFKDKSLEVIYLFYPASKC
jgi:hypothetical protein